MNLCKTRWIYRHRAIDAFHGLYPCVVAALREISESTSKQWDAENRTRSLGLLTSIVTFEFRFAFVVARHVFQYLEDITISLQSSSKDIIEAYNDVEVVKAQLQKVRREIDARHAVWMSEAKQMGETVGDTNEPKLPRRARGTASVIVEEFLRKTVSLQFLDEVVGHLDTRFSRMRYVVQSGLCLVPSIAITMPQEAFVKSAQNLPRNMSMTCHMPPPFHRS